MKIRKYSPTDRKAVEHIHFETGFVGKSMSEFLSNNKLYKKFISYYLDKEPESCFVLEEKGKVLGYVFGCLNDKDHNETLEVFKTTFGNYFRSWFLPRKDRIYWASQVCALFRAAFGISEELKFHPPKNAGHLHINLLPGARGKKQGTKLLKTFESYAKKNGVKILHGDSYLTKRNPNQNFWLKNGYKATSKVKTSFWKKQLPKEKIYLVSYVKKL